MKSFILALILGGIPCVAYAENPFVERFGGPYQSIEPTFMKSAAEYGTLWLQTYQVLGKAALEDKKGFAKFVAGEVDPRLAGMNPKSTEEERIKDAAILVKTVFQAVVNPSQFTKEDLADIEVFLAACAPRGEATSNPDKLAFVLIRYQEFVIGKRVVP